MVPSFSRRAQFTTKFGIRVVPSQKGLKYSNLVNWPNLATISPKQIATWDAEDPMSRAE